MKCVTFGCAVGVVAFAISSLGTAAGGGEASLPEPAVVRRSSAS
jgi:hypothetical protein